MSQISIVLSLFLLEIIAIPVFAFMNIPSNMVYLPVINSIDKDSIELCSYESLPVGAVTGQPLPVFCNIVNQGPDTSTSGDNSWNDDFNHDLSFADITKTEYTVFENTGFVRRTMHWRHADHWMVDIASVEDMGIRGGALIRPDKTFRFRDGTFIVEAVTAAGIKEYGTNAWPELVISTSPTPTDFGSLYAYDLFPEGHTIGCRLQATRYPVCSFKTNDGNIATGEISTRVWEMSAHQAVGTQNFGGSPFEGREDYWRICNNTDPDMACRDQFRLEITRTSLTLFVNGNKYFEQKDIPPLPDAFVNGDIYVYFASMVVSHPADVVRFHWDHVSVNPENTSSFPKDENPLYLKRNWR